MYTIENWRKDHTFNPQVGEEVSLEVVEEMRDCVPPETMTKNYLQVGEAYSRDWETGQDLYTTFERRKDGKWYYIGHKPTMRKGWL